MPKTQIRSEQIANQQVKRVNLNTTSAGQAIIAKILAGTGISIGSTGIDSGTGDVTISVNNTVITTNDTQTLSNKSLVDSSTFFIDGADSTKKLRLELSGLSSGTTRIITVPDIDFTISPLNSPNFTGIPTAPTAALNTNTAQLATTAFVQAAVASLVNAAPTQLDTLNELAAALGNDANFATTITNQLAGKQPTGNYITALTGDVAATGPNSASATVTKIQGRNITSAAPSNGQALIWNNSATQWEPQTIEDALENIDAGGIVGILGLACGGTGSDLSATGPGFLKQATSGAPVSVSAIAISDVTGLTAALAAAGQVQSVFGRTGVVTAQASDYSAFYALASHNHDAAYQPLDSDLTAIAALSTTSFGRGLLTETNAASLKSTLSLGSVENTALSTWAGSTNITTLGTIGTGVWNATAIAQAKVASLVASGKTFTANNSLTLAGTDGTAHTFPASNSTLARTDAAQTFSGTQTISLSGAGNLTAIAAQNLTSNLTAYLQVGSSGWLLGAATGAGASNAALQITSAAPGNALVLAASQLTVGYSDGIIAAAGQDLLMKSEGGGTAGYSVKLQGYTGAAWQTAIQLPNKSGGSPIDVHLVPSGGNVGINTTSPGAQLQVNASASNVIGQIVKGAVSQSSDLMQWQNSSGVVLAAIKANGQISASRSGEGQIEVINPSASSDGTWSHAIGGGGQFGHGEYAIGVGTSPAALSYSLKLYSYGVVNARVAFSAPDYRSNLTGVGPASIVKWTNTGTNFDGYLEVGGTNGNIGSVARSIRNIIGTWGTSQWDVRDLSNNVFLTVLKSGNVGIGTSSPVSLFSVGANSEFQVRSNGSIKPASMTDAAAANDSIYYSTTQNKLCYKDSSGVSNPLY